MKLNYVFWSIGIWVIQQGNPYPSHLSILVSNLNLESPSWGAWSLIIEMSDWLKNSSRTNLPLGYYQNDVSLWILIWWKIKLMETLDLFGLRKTIFYFLFSIIITKISSCIGNTKKTKCFNHFLYKSLNTRNKVTFF